TPVIEDGVIVPFGGVYWRADVDTKQQRAELLTRDPTADDDLVALVHPANDVAVVHVALAHGQGLAGDLLDAPPAALPARPCTFTRAPVTGAVGFVGLVSGAATLRRGGVEHKLVVYAGTDQLREALATPTRWPEPMTVKHRVDDLSFAKRRAEIR